ncbi:hypothetical protein ABPG75_003601 [Micractinium tetrahymenae]
MSAAPTTVLRYALPSDNTCGGINFLLSNPTSKPGCVYTVTTFPKSADTGKDFLFPLAAPAVFTFPANTLCTFQLLGNSTRQASTVAFRKFTQLVEGPTPTGPGCFPAAATVQVWGRGFVAMQELRPGDRVLALDHATGRLAYRSAYIFAHREPGASGAFVNIEAVPLAAEEAGGASSNATMRHRLQLSPRHFLPVCAAGDAAACGAPRLSGLLDSLRSLGTSEGWRQRYGQEVQPGMLVLLADGEGGLAPARVLRVWQSVERGLFNPLVEGGTLVVDGVLASDQSDWILDDVVPASWRPLLPAVYGMLMSPLRLLFHLLGPAGLERLDSALGITWAGHNHGASLAAALPATAAVAMLAAAAARAPRSRQ